MRKFVFGILLSVLFIMPAATMDYTGSSVRFNLTFNIGTFSAGENYGGSVFLGSSISMDWIPDGNTGLSYGIETGLLGGKKYNNTIYGIPIIFRFGWQPGFLRFDNTEIFILGKLGWAFGIWGSDLDPGSSPNGIVCGFNFGGRYVLTQNIGIYAEAGYNYYGFARNSNYPEYPLGYGSGKTYTSFGLTFR